MTVIYTLADLVYDVGDLSLKVIEYVTKVHQQGITSCFDLFEHLQILFELLFDVLLLIFYLFHILTDGLLLSSIFASLNNRFNWDYF